MRIWQKGHCKNFQVRRVIGKIVRSGQRVPKLIPCPQQKVIFHPGVQDIQVWWADLHVSVLTWFFPFSISRLVTFPKGSPSPITSASFMSLGSLRTWTTRDGTPGLRTSPLNFLVSLPLAAREKKQKQIQSGREQRALVCLCCHDDQSIIQQERDTTSTSIKRIHPSMATPYLSSWYRARWICRKKRARRIPSAEGGKTMVHFSAFTNKGTAWQVESTALILQSHCVINQEVIW